MELDLSVNPPTVFRKDGTAGDTMVLREATQTLTNKTLTAPTITAPTITGAATLASGAALTSPVVTTPTYTKKMETVITTNVITAAESGTVFFLDLVTGFVSTLPAVAPGLEFEFVIVTQPTNGGHTVVGASGTPIVGHVLSSDLNANDSDFGTAGELTVTFVASKAVKGDRVKLVCNGTNWFAQAACSAFDAITIS